ncbi:carbohydrate ABC transporter substrate-binding protein (CUT1 family) [Paenibacillus taihuensis]|uniref:Carbohydrate ABC transporter substrate-binding protein (CUT1 family) n=1 Tax=Paenibacillus taihuensis TaxID=1156355 RepID=A0A3D9RZ46_9BACL|nr:extracellular solute-binding protein [Paenibacillus taihuensis]REE85338.1 carbohydrate ABC transporter substrate-binding protein (CUT1 family) [Paenibacillus taihuensis]
MKNSWRTLLGAVLTASLIIGVCQPQLASAEGILVGDASPDSQQKQQSASAQAQHIQLERSYTDMLKEWSAVPALPHAEVTINPSVEPANVSLIAAKNESFGYTTDTVRLTPHSQLTAKLDVPQTGLYQIGFDYYITDDSILPTEGFIQVNGKYPFYESRRILFPNLWENQQTAQKLDRYGNELLPHPQKVKAWQHGYAMDASYAYMKPLLYKLNKGINTITIANTRGELLLGNITADSPSEIDRYEAYTKNQPQPSDNSPLKSPIVIEAETPVYKNDSSIRAISIDDPQMTPYDTKHRMLNGFGGTWASGGQAATWEFDAPKDGYYRIAMKYKQDSLRDMPVFRQIAIDGKVPFRELQDYGFQYSKSWNNAVLGGSGSDSGSGDEPYEFYFTKGKHALTMAVDLEPIRPLTEVIENQMEQISKLSLEIRKLTGNHTDAYRDWDLSEYIPNLDKTLTGWADQLESEYGKLNKLNADGGEIAELNNLTKAASQLRSLAEEPDKLPNRMALFSEGSTSVSQLLGDLLQRITHSPMALDKIYVYQEGKLPKANAGFFKKFRESVKRFFLSFTKQSYSASSKSSTELNVWVHNSREQVELMQKMIDEEFTPQSGINVKLSIMPDENKLVLANATGSQPDAALGISSWIPYDLAVRNAAVDLRKFDDYEQVVKPFSKGAMIPFAYGDGVYALPESQDFWVLFYRKDILDNLKLSVPNTWDDVVNMLPELQRLGMNFYDPLALYKGFKPLGATTPFIYQFGGELFTDDGMKTAINSEQALKGIKFMTDLFTIYNLPQDVPNFYQHFRSGILPIGISDLSTYIQLKVAAPEIANSWKIALHPGTMQDGTVQRWSPSGGTSAMIFKGTKQEQEAWDFLKWWMSTKVQVEFANMEQAEFGPMFMWNSANMDAFAESPWPEEDKQTILEQSKWVREASRVPGAYMVERELSNVFNSVVFDGDNPRTAVDDSVIRANREIDKKMEEFGFIKNGKQVKDNPVPTINTIDKWVEKR